jgi:tRNA A37 methylthiotransferase MiaB
MKGLGGTVKKERSKALTGLKREVCGEAYDAMVGDRRRVLAVRPGTGDSVKCRDGAYRQVVVQNAGEHGVEPGAFLDVEVTEGRTVYALGTPV